MDKLARLTTEVCDLATQVGKNHALSMKKDRTEDAAEGLIDHAKWFWLVDPLDGTKEFFKGTNEFTVNVALIETRGRYWELCMRRLSVAPIMVCEISDLGVRLMVGRQSRFRPGAPVLRSWRLSLVRITLALWSARC
jgi:hypothetical protein